MKTTYADVAEGTRVDITVEFVSRRSTTIADGHIARLLVADRIGTEFPILVPPSTLLHSGLKTGVTYRIEGLIGADPSFAETTTDMDCQECNGSLRAGQAIDAVFTPSSPVMDAFDLAEPFGLVDEETSVHRVSTGDRVVDDWIPMQDHAPISTPAYVCDACGARPERHEFQDESIEGQILANQAPANASPAPAANMASQETVGLAAGGAKDVTNFRDNVANGYTPQPEAISDEGLFYDYYFDTGDGTDGDALFAPRYAAAATDHPLTGETEQYLSVGLDSTLSVVNFERPRLDFVAVLDVSGSMSSEFDQYYYDEHGRRREAACDATTKLDAAIQSLCALTEQLHGDDRLGVVLYNHRAHVAKPVRDVGSTDMPAIRRHIREIAAGGSTNLADGYEAAVDMFAESPVPESNLERRVVFMTDMKPNAGVTDEDELTSLFANAATRGIHTTFVGMGIDTNAELVDALSAIRGANHYFVHSADEFEQRLVKEFEYMVTPLVYDIDLELETDGYEVGAVHGSPSDDEATNRLMHVGTLFPSAKQDGEARGGVILVRLERTAADPDAELVASWTERDGGQYTERVTVDIPDTPESFAHSGIRKAVVLARYARVLRAWARDVHKRDASGTGVDDWLLPEQRGQHERESVPLVVPDEYAARFETLRDYLETEMAILRDVTLTQELALLATLTKDAPTTKREVTE